MPKLGECRHLGLCRHLALRSSSDCGWLGGCLNQHCAVECQVWGVRLAGRCSCPSEAAENAFAVDLNWNWEGIRRYGVEFRSRARGWTSQPTRHGACGLDMSPQRLYRTCRFLESVALSWVVVAAALRRTWRGLTSICHAGMGRSGLQQKSGSCSTGLPWMDLIKWKTHGHPCK